jgi:UDP-3-O-[3-hydroxymyristoyl] glucosamine N-acyltransferase
MPNVLSISSLTVLLIAIDLPAQREFMPDQFALQRFRRGRPQASIVGASMATTTIRAVSLPPKSAAADGNEHRGDFLMKLRELGQRLQCRIEGDPDVEISSVAGLETAGPGQITFLANLKYRAQLRTTRAAAAILADDEQVEREAGLPPLALLRSANPYLDFARALGEFHPAPRYAPGVHPTAVVAPTARIAEGAHIGPYCFVDEGAVIGRNTVLHSFVTVYRDAHIGDDCLAHAHAVIREACKIGNRVILQNGVIIGADGFGFAKDSAGHWQKIPQTGPTEIEDDVEIQANACVDRATVGRTLIRRGVKIDDLALVGHGAEIGEDTLLCGQVGISGSARVGKNCLLLGQVGCAGHLEIGDGAILTPQSGVAHDVPAGAYLSGAPVMDHRLWMKSSVALKSLPDLVHTVRELRAKVERLTAQDSGD